MSHRLPNGKETANVKEYLNEWRKLAEPIEKVTGLKHWCFDPNIGFISKDEKYNIDLPVWFILLINKALESKKGQHHDL